VPRLVKCLADVKERCSTVLFIFHGCINCVGDAVTMLDCRVSFSEAKLMIWYPGVGVCVIVDLSGYQFLQYFGNGGKQAYRAV
jgi:hypothetical protein